MDGSHPAFMRWLNDIDDTGFSASLGILWDGFIRPQDLLSMAGGPVQYLKATSAAAADMTRDISERRSRGVDPTDPF